MMLHLLWNDTVHGLHCHHSPGDLVQRGGVGVEVEVSENVGRLHRDEVGLEGEPKGGQLVHEGKGAVHAQLLQSLVTQQRPGETCATKLRPVFKSVCVKSFVKRQIFLRFSTFVHLERT
jgi:hypothetical protein